MDYKGAASALSCNNKNTVFNILRGVLAAAVAAGVILTVPAYADVVHTGEDGLIYRLDGGDVDVVAPEQENWTQGKIESILVEESGTMAQLDVIVYVKRGAAKNGSEGLAAPL